MCSCSLIFHPMLSSSQIIFCTVGLEKQSDCKFVLDSVGEKEGGTEGEGDKRERERSERSTRPDGHVSTVY